MAAARTVKLKDDPKPKGPAIRIYRDEDGFSFIVGTVDKNGVGDFRTESLHNSFEEAVKQAEYRVDQFRLPLINDTGAEIAANAKPVATTSAAPATKALPTKQKIGPSADALAKELGALPSLASNFTLPEGDPCPNLDLEQLAKRADLTFREMRTRGEEEHAQIYGDARDFTCTFTQATYDRLQTQMRRILERTILQQTILYGFLERAFARIEELENAPKGMSYKGVFRDGQTYEAGDVCTHGGSAWHCNERTTDKPEHGPWTLCVKRGRDGKDMRNAA